MKSYIGLYLLQTVSEALFLASCRYIDMSTPCMSASSSHSSFTGVHRTPNMQVQALVFNVALKGKGTV